VGRSKYKVTVAIKPLDGKPSKGVWENPQHRFSSADRRGTGWAGQWAVRKGKSRKLREGVEKGNLTTSKKGGKNQKVHILLRSKRKRRETPEGREIAGII